MKEGPSGRVGATYRLATRDVGAARRLAEWIAREQTVEVPPGVGGDEPERRMLGLVEAVTPVDEEAFEARLAFPLAVTGVELPQLLNVLYGNVSLMNGVRLVDVSLPGPVLDAMPGPRLGIEGLRGMVGVSTRRPLVSVAIKPVGRTPAELAELAGTFARAGVDVIKDDHGLADQPSAPFTERVAAVARAVHDESDARGRPCAYFPNVTGPADGLRGRVDAALDAGCSGVMLCPSLVGLDTMRVLAAAGDGPAIMAHPAHAQSAPGRREGIAPELLFGTLYRLAGADVVVYVNAEGRFSWPVAVCEAINARLREPLGALRPAFPAPAGGVDADRAGSWLARYGPDTMLLIGGSLLAAPDVLGATRRLVAVAEGAAAGPAATAVAGPPPAESPG